MKRPSFQFYPQDWRNDPLLQMCSLAAKGLWIEMMGLMHEAQPYGHLKFNGKSVDLSTLSLLIRADLDTTKRAFNELEEHGVFSKNKDEIIYCRRMIRDEIKRKDWRKSQKNWRNQHRTKDMQQSPVKPMSTENKSSVNSPVKPMSTRSSSSSSSSSSTSTSKKNTDLAAANALPGVALWLTDPDDPNDPGKLQMDDEFKRLAAAEVRRHSQELEKADPGGPRDVNLSKIEWEEAVRDLTQMLVARKYLRATERSKPKKVREFRSLIIGRFQDRLSRKRARIANARQRDGPREPRGFAGIREHMEETDGK